MTGFFMGTPACPRCKRPMSPRMVVKDGVWQTVWECRKHPKAEA